MDWFQQAPRAQNEVSKNSSLYLQSTVVFPKSLSIVNTEHSVFFASFCPLKTRQLPFLFLGRARLVFKMVFTHFLV
jgi:hypothetical protein